jgi:hypothetical protein
LKIENSRRLPLVLSISLICLGVSQWIDSSESSMRWKWLQDITNSMFGEHGHAKFLMFFGVAWLLWNLISLFKDSSGEVR